MLRQTKVIAPAATRTVGMGMSLELFAVVGFIVAVLAAIYCCARYSTLVKRHNEAKAALEVKYSIKSFVAFNDGNDPEEALAGMRAYREAFLSDSEETFFVSRGEVSAKTILKDLAAIEPELERIYNSEGSAIEKFDELKELQISIERFDLPHPSWIISDRLGDWYFDVWFWTSLFLVVAGLSAVLTPLTP